MSCTDKKYIVKEILVSSTTGLQGPIGPAGPPGPPGPVPSEFPADQVTVTNPGYTDLQEILDDLLYVPVDITSFSGGTAQFEIGRLLTAITFTWVINKDIVSQTLVGPAEMTPVVLTPGQRSVTVILANLDANAVFTLTVNDEKQSDIRTFNVTFVNRNYFGDSVIPLTIDDAFVKSLQSILKGNRTHLFETDAVGLEYCWYCFPSLYGTPTFIVGGFEGGFQKIQTLSFTNDYGYTENYEIYRSDFPGIGPNLNIQVT